jgi:hypothetical protein
MFFQVPVIFNAKIDSLGQSASHLRSDTTLEEFFMLVRGTVTGQGHGIFILATHPEGT